MKNELNDIWSKRKFADRAAESVKQVVNICNALIKVDESAPYSRQCNSSMIEAKQCIEELEQYVKSSASISISNQSESDNTVYQLLVAAPLAVVKNFSAFRSLASDGHIFGGSEIIKMPYQVIAKLTNQISPSRKRQILAVSYLVDREVGGLSDLELNYVKKTLENMKKDIDKFRLLQE